MTVLLVMAGLVVASLWLRRRDQRAYERRLAQETAARAVAEDRLVIARELHDAVSGNLGAITVRCAVAQRLETDTDGLRHALRDIEENCGGCWECCARIPDPQRRPCRRCRRTRRRVLADGC